jgi:hypothetical protein
MLMLAVILWLSCFASLLEFAHRAPLIDAVESL